MLTDKTVSYCCENVFFIDLKPLFSSFLPVPRKNLKFRQELLNQRINGPVKAHLISWPSKAQNLENIW